MASKSYRTRSKSKSQTSNVAQEIADLSAQIEELQMSLPSVSPSHAGAQQRVAPLLTPQAIEAPSLAQQLQLERTKQENLKLQLELTKAQLELARFNAPISAPVEPLADVLSSTPARPLTDVPNLATLRKLRRDRAVLPNEFLFTTSKDRSQQLIHYAYEVQRFAFQESTKRNM
ncbi:uncharacterized protein LOC116620090 [Nematostella vectensis]|uniref:uncharacterized protein LOC116620090 n=1 Tax=Nematostella vectensis TaxID=45351 RepID=UPI001390663B|nr:uncharacterized protein LOC116620090 [Nematostella vectensis]